MSLAIQQALMLIDAAISVKMNTTEVEETLHFFFNLE